MIRFLHGWSLHLVTSARKVGSFGGHIIYSVEVSRMQQVQFECAALIVGIAPHLSALIAALRLFLMLTARFVANRTRSWCR